MSNEPLTREAVISHYEDHGDAVPTDRILQLVDERDRAWGQLDGWAALLGIGDEYWAPPGAKDREAFVTFFRALNEHGRRGALESSQFCRDKLAAMRIADDWRAKAEQLREMAEKALEQREVAGRGGALSDTKHLTAMLDMTDKMRLTAEAERDDARASVERLSIEISALMRDGAEVAAELKDARAFANTECAARMEAQAELAKVTAERDEARDAATWEGKEALTAALEAVERQGEQAHERALAAEAERDEALRERKHVIAGLQESAAARLAAEADAERLAWALEALVAGVEDSVLRFLDQHELQLRPDMDEVLRARVARARAALVITPGRTLEHERQRVRAEEAIEFELLSQALTDAYDSGRHDEFHGWHDAIHGKRAEPDVQHNAEAWVEEYTERVRAEALREAISAVNGGGPYRDGQIYAEIRNVLERLVASPPESKEQP